MFPLFFVLFYMYYLYEKYYTLMTVQYYIANCVVWVPRLTSLDLRTIGLKASTLRTELACMQGTCCNIVLSILPVRKWRLRKIKSPEITQLVWP